MPSKLDFSSSSSGSPAVADLRYGEEDSIRGTLEVNPVPKLKSVWSEWMKTTSLAE